VEPVVEWFETAESGRFLFLEDVREGGQSLFVEGCCRQSQGLSYLMKAVLLSGGIFEALVYFCS
jgi:hypothetical protein